MDKSDVDSLNSQFETGAGSLIEGVALRLPAGRVVLRLLSIGLDAVVRDVGLQAEDQIPRGASNQDAAFRLVYNGARVRGIRIENFDSSAIIYNASDIIIDGADFYNYLKAIDLDNCGNIKLRDLTGHPIPTGAPTNPGNNFIGGEPYGDLEIDRCTSYGSGEHSIYLSSDAAVIGSSKKFLIRNSRSHRSGQCVIKLRGWANFEISGVVGGDTSYGNAPGTNEDGLRFEWCGNGIVSNTHMRPEAHPRACYVGAYISDSANIRFDGYHVEGCYSHLMEIIESYDITGSVSARNVGGDAVRITGALSASGNIRLDVDVDGVTGLIANIMPTPGAAEFTKTVEITGRTDKAGLLYATGGPANFDVRLHGVGGDALAPATRKWLNRTSASSTSIQLRAIDDLISWLAATGLKSKFDRFAIFGVGDEGRGLIDLLDPMKAVVAINAPSYNPREGYAGNGVNSYLSVVSPTDLSAYTVNSAHYGFTCRSSGAAVTDMVGQVSAAGANDRFRCNPLHTDGNLHARINDPIPLLVAQSDARGHYIVNRSEASARQVYKNGAVVGSDTQASSSLITGTMFLLRWGSAYDTRTVGSFHIGASLTAAEAAALSPRVQKVFDVVAGA